MTTPIFVLYVNAIAVLLTVAAQMAHTACGALGFARRWIWIGALLGSFAFLLSTAIFPNSPLSAPTSSALPSPVALPSDIPKWDVLLLCTMVSALLLLVVDYTRLYRQRRLWQPSSMDGVSVLVSNGFGPAVVGFRTPQIVVPPHVFTLSPEQRALVLAHEHEHQRAHDGRLVLAACVLVALCPWVIALWWQVHQLRSAIEFDCDRRVMRNTASRHQYASLLVDMVTRTTNTSRRVVALAALPSLVHRRVQALYSTPKGPYNASVLRPAIACVVSVAAACTTPAPDGPPYVARVARQLQQELRTRQERLIGTIASEERELNTRKPPGMLDEYLKAWVPQPSPSISNEPRWRFRREFVTPPAAADWRKLPLK